MLGNLNQTKRFFSSHWLSLQHFFWHVGNSPLFHEAQLLSQNWPVSPLAIDLAHSFWVGLVTRVTVCSHFNYTEDKITSVMCIHKTAWSNMRKNKWGSVRSGRNIITAWSPSERFMTKDISIYRLKKATRVKEFSFSSSLRIIIQHKCGDVEVCAVLYHKLHGGKNCYFISWIWFYSPLRYRFCLRRTSQGPISCHVHRLGVTEPISYQITWQAFVGELCANESHIDSYRSYRYHSGMLMCLRGFFSMDTSTKKKLLKETDNPDKIPSVMWSLTDVRGYSKRPGILHTSRILINFIFWLIQI